jgi:VWFA-related protein
MTPFRVSTVFLIALVTAIALAQIQAVPPNQTNAATNAGPQAPAGQPDDLMAIKVRVNLVQMRVVVRDSYGRAVDNLKREDFQIYDQGKPQTISSFGVETDESRREKGGAADSSPSGLGASGRGEKTSWPDRFVALVFDDVHLSLQGASNARNAAQRFMDGMAPTDRMAIYSTSGQLTQDFTNDPEPLRRILLNIAPRPLAVTNDRTCPNVPYSLADRIDNGNDSDGFDTVVQETLMCAFGGDPKKIRFAQSMAQAAIHQALRAGEAETDLTFRRIEDAVHHLAGMPGERIMVLVSPGFSLSKQSLDERGIVEQANRANIVINTLDVRGLYVPGGEDISKPTTDTLETAEYKSNDRMEAEREQFTVLADFAYGTGGTFFHNSNDLQGGLKMAGASPEICYVLGYAPQNLKPDGKYHSIEVKLTGKQKYSVQARRGYYAPRTLSPEAQAAQEIADAMYSREETGDLLLKLEAEPVAENKSQAQLNVVSQVAVKNVHFRKEDGKSLDVLRMVTAIFDSNGNLVTGGEKVLTMKLDDAQYQTLSAAGLIVKSSFELKPGKYLVRQLIRDSEAGEIAARNRAVEIAN